jgi:hypothetical protein
MLTRATEQVQGAAQVIRPEGFRGSFRANRAEGRQADASVSVWSVGAEMDGLRSLIVARACRTPAP